MKPISTDDEQYTINMFILWSLTHALCPHVRQVQSKYLRDTWFPRGYIFLRATYRREHRENKSVPK